MNVVDSSGWLEYFADETNADFFAPAIENTVELLVPSISVYEVFKRVLQQRGEQSALQIAALMAQGEIIDLDQTLALAAAKISHELKLPMTDSIILATARSRNATLWTQDSDFTGIENVNYVAKIQLYRDMYRRKQIRRRQRQTRRLVLSQTHRKSPSKTKTAATTNTLMIFRRIAIEFLFVGLGRYPFCVTMNPRKIFGTFRA